MIFGGLDGFTFFEPELVVFNDHSPQLEIIEVEIYDQQAPSGSVSLSSLRPEGEIVDLNHK